MKLEIDNDWIHINKYLYNNTGFSFDTSGQVLHKYYRVQIDFESSYEKSSYNTNPVRYP